MKTGISGMLEAKPHLWSYEWIILISSWVVRNQFVLHRNAICSWSLCMRLEFSPLLSICFITEWNFELIFSDIFHLMHFNVYFTQISASIEHIILSFSFFFLIVALGCGKGGGDAFFKILTLIGVDTQPSHECIWRNVPIFKINDDGWMLLRKMELPRQPQHHYVDEARGAGAWWCGKHPLQEGRARSQSKLRAGFRKEWNVWLMKRNQSPLGLEETRPWGWCDPRGGVQVGAMRPASSPAEQGLG